MIVGAFLMVLGILGSIFVFCFMFLKEEIVPDLLYRRSMLTNLILGLSLVAVGGVVMTVYSRGVPLDDISSGKYLQTRRPFVGCFEEIKPSGKEAGTLCYDLSGLPELYNLDKLPEKFEVIFRQGKTVIVEDE